MALVGYPLNTKYAPGDDVFAFVNGRVLQLEVEGWEVTVDNPSGDGKTGRELKYYNFVDRPNLRIEEFNLFSSLNHIRSFIKDDYINRAIESGGGASGIFSGLYLKDDLAALSMASWTDFGGWDMASANLLITEQTVSGGTASATSGSAAIVGDGTAFTTEAVVGGTFTISDGVNSDWTGTILSITDDEHMTATTNAPNNLVDGEISQRTIPSPVTLATAELILDGAFMWLAVLPTAIDTLSEIMAAIKSYDRYTSKWTDNRQFYRSSATGTVAISIGSPVITGTGTAFLSEVRKGDEIMIGSSYAVITEVTDNTHMSIGSNWSIALTGQTMTIFPAPRNV